MSQSTRQSFRFSSERLQLLRKRRRASGVESPAGSGIGRRKEDGPARLSFAQKRLWLLDRLKPGNAAYNVPTAVRLRGRLSTHRLARALERLADRHEVLRTRFLEQNGEPVQMIEPGGGVALPVVDLEAAEDRASPLRAMVVEEARRPFDLEQAPLLRALLLRQGERDHTLVLTMHHIVSDGWSRRIVLEEFAALYRQEALGAEIDLPTFEIQYADFAEWQQERYEAEGFKASLASWEEMLADAPGHLELPFDRQRPPVQTFRGAACSWVLDRRVAAGLRRLGREANATPFVAFLAAFEVFLSRYSGQVDFCIGTPVANRTRVELENLVGFFVNMTVLRANVADTSSFREVLARARDVVLHAQEHQDVPFELLVETLNPERHLSHSPLFQVVFTMADELPQSLAVGDLSLEPMDLDGETAKFDLTLSIRERRDDLVGTFVFSRDLFETRTIERAIGNLNVLLTAIVAEPDRPVRELPMMGAGERQLLLAEWNDTGTDHGPALPVHRQVTLAAENEPDAVALEDREVRLSFAELDRRANRLARHLRRLGVGPESRVGVCTGRSAWAVVGQVATLKAGGAFVPIDPAYPTERLRFIIEDAGIGVALLRSRHVGPLPLPPGLTTLELDDPDDEWREAPADDPEVPVPLESLAYVIYTSGSTGWPKGVGISHRALLNLVGWHRSEYRLEAGMRSALVAGVAFDASVWETWPHLTSGVGLSIPDEETRMTPARLRDWLASAGVDLAFVPTPMAEALLEADWSGLRAPSVILTGGDRLARRPKEGCPFRLVNHYGPTENAVVATFAPVEPGVDCEHAPPIGRPVDNVRCYVLDASLQPVPGRVPGELYLAGRSLARGYLGQRRHTAERFLPDGFSGLPGLRLYRTGDLVRRGRGGQLEFIGRTDDQIKIRGFRIEIGEIETAIVAEPGVAETVVVAKEWHGERRLVAYVVPDGEALPSIPLLRDALSRRLPDYMVPAAFVALDALPLTAHDKVDRQALPEPERGWAVGRGDEPPRNPIEARLADLWCELLDLPRIGVHRSFFDVGGHSLKATQLLSLVQQEYDVTIGLADFFAEPTVAGLARRLEHLPPVTLPEPEPIAPRGSYPLSHAQRRLWVLHQFAEESTAYNIPVAFLVQGDLDVGNLERAIQNLIERHESLRTVFEVQRGSPVQVVLNNARIRVEVRDLEPEPDPLEAAREIAIADANTPFDLASWPLLRVTALRLGEGRHALVCNIHHIVSDGWSMGVIFREVAELYNASRSGREPELEPLPIQYRDYAAWQAGLLRGERLEFERRYWRRRLEGAPDGVELPLDRPRRPIQTFNGRRVAFDLSPSLVQECRRLAAANRSTLFMVLLAALYALLHRYTGQSDLMVGTPVAGRQHPALRSMIGFLVNTLVLRQACRGSDPFRELLAGVHRTTIEAYEHQLYPFDLVLEDLDLERDLSKPVLFNVMLAHNNTDLAKAPPAVEGLTVSPFVSGDFNMSKFDLILFIDEEGEGLHCRLEFNLDLFDRTTAERLAHNYRVLLGSIAEDGSDTAVRELGLLADRELHQVLRGFQGAPLEFPFRPIQRMVEEQVGRSPEAVAVVHGDTHVSFLELNWRANRLARWLRDRGGVRPGDLVGLMIDRSVGMLVGLLGVVKAGAGYVALDPTYPEERILHMLLDSGVDLLLAAGPPPGLLGSFEGRILDLEALAEDLDGLPAEDFDTESRPSDTVYVIYTSGSTGTPNGAMLSHSLLSNLLEWQRRVVGLGGLGCLQFTSLSFCVSFQEIFGSLTTGGCLHLIGEVERQDVDHLRSMLERSRIELLHLPFSYLNFLFDESNALGSGFRHGLRHIVTAGEQLKVSASMQAFLDANPDLELHNHYGSSEAHVVTAFTLDAESAPRHPVPPVGSPISNTRIYILDPHGRPVPTGVWGEIYVRPGGVARGYVNNPALTASKYVPDPFGEDTGGVLYGTGDLGRWLADGTIVFHGRIDTQVKVRGFRVELGEVESILLAIDGVRQSVVVVRKEGSERRSLLAYLVASPELDLRGVQDVLKHTLPQFMVPILVPLPSLPLMPNGKVDRERLPDPSELGVELEQERLAPRTPIERRIAEIWCELLRLDQVSVNESFFDLGGHSLTATQAIARILQEWGVRVQLIDVFQEPTVAALARRVEEALEGAGDGKADSLLAKVDAGLEEVASMSPEEIDALLAAGSPRAAVEPREE
ncbi:MAG: amino acid adenylation domain-containing protein [bacterium]